MVQDSMLPRDPVAEIIERLSQDWATESAASFEYMRRSFGQTTRFDFFQRRLVRGDIFASQARRVRDAALLHVSSIKVVGCGDLVHTTQEITP